MYLPRTPPFGLSRSGGGDRTTSAGLDGRHRLDQAPPMNEQNRLASPELTELSIGVGGMTCATCTGRVERFLRRVPGVAQVRVDLVGERAFIELDPQLTGREELAAAIRAAGYEPRVETESPLADDDLSLLGRFDDAERRLLNESLFALGVGGVAMIVMIGGLMSPLVSWALLIAATLVQFISGRRIYVGALRAARARSSSMETLIAIGTTSAYLSGLLATLAPGLAHSLGLHGGYLEIAPIVLGFVLLGRLIEGRARRRAGDALRALAALRPTLARILRDGVESSLPVASIRVGDLLLVSAGERIPVDGVVVEGAASIDESAVSGESRPLERSGGQPLIGGSTVASGSLTMRATATGAESVLGKMIALVERAQSTKAPIARLADTIAAHFVPAVLLFALAVAAFTLLAGPEPRVASALAQTIAILVVACPCALGLATPVALAVGLGRGAEAGILVRDAGALESTSRLRTLVFDKTGTLTLGRPDLISLYTPAGDDDAVLALAAGLEAGDEHPIGGAIARRAGELGVIPLAVGSLERLAGRGARGELDGVRIAIGSPRLAREEGVDLAPIEERLAKIDANGSTPVLLVGEGKLLALFEIADTLRPEAGAALRSLERAGVECWIASGDRRAAVERVGALLGLPRERLIAELLPEEKQALIERLRARGPVGMVGDGINDAPALAAADLGIAIGSGATLAREAAAVTIVRSDLRLIGTAVGLARSTLGLIRANLAWAFLYNIALLPIAAGVARPLGIMLSPELAALAMALSSIAVVLNSLRLRAYPIA